MLRFLIAILYVAMALFPADAVSRSSRVAHVYDGDTVKLSHGQKVRLLGIDSTETGKEGDADEPFSQEAGERVREWIGGQKVTLIRGGERKDRYGRHLAFVETEAGVDVGARLLAEGLALVYVHPAAQDRLEEYLRLEDEARGKGVGIWSRPGVRLVDHAEAARHAGGYRIVRGRVVQASITRKRVYLNFGTDWKRDFTVTIPNRDLKYFRQAEIDPRKYQGRIVEVRGRIHDRNGPSIQVSHPLAIRIVEE